MKQVFLAFTVVLAVFAGMAAPARSEPIVTYVLDNGGADGNASA
jgi:energy-converting hydrogenase Eha subunit E